MSDASITYLECPEPFKVGEYNGRDILQFGGYRVDLGGFAYLQPHTGIPGTIGAELLPLDDPDIRAALIVAAEEARDKMKAERGDSQSGADHPESISAVEKAEEGE